VSKNESGFTLPEFLVKPAKLTLSALHSAACQLSTARCRANSAVKNHHSAPKPPVACFLRFSIAENHCLSLHPATLLCAKIPPRRYRRAYGIVMLLNLFRNYFFSEDASGTETCSWMISHLSARFSHTTVQRPSSGLLLPSFMTVSACQVAVPQASFPWVCT